MKKKIYIICPVRIATPEQTKAIQRYVYELEYQGHEVFWPARDNPYEGVDDIGMKICYANAQAIKDCDEVHIWYDSASQGSLFDMGIAFVLGRPLRIINGPLDTSNTKNFARVLTKWAEDSEFIDKLIEHPSGKWEPQYQEYFKRKAEEERKRREVERNNGTA